jgi:hypothetical protein
MEKLGELIDEAYRLFEPYHIGDELAVCTACCVNAGDALALKTLKRQDMPATLIYQYLDAACDPDDPLLISQMKYLLPRILELLVQGAYLRHSTEITLSKCFCMNTAWSVQEIDFLQRFALVYFAQQFDTYNTAAEAQDILVMFHLAGLDITPLLQSWQRLIEQPIALWGLISLIAWCSGQGVYSNAFSDHALSQQIADWLNTVEFRDAIRSSILEHVDELIVAGLPGFKI